MKSFYLPIIIVLLSGCTFQNGQPNDTQKNNAVMTNGGAPVVGTTLEPITTSPTTLSGTNPIVEQVKVEIDDETLLENGNLVFGSPEAPHTLHIFTEYNCEYCDDFHNQYLGWLKNEYVKSGKLQIHLSLLPLEKYAASAENQRLLLCAAKQNKGGAVHHFLTNTDEPTRASLLQNNEVVDLNIDTFSLCINNPTTDALVAAQNTLSKQQQVTMVPTLILNGEKQVGLPYEADMRGWMKSIVK
jgi:protein-disulfide isomerase